MQFSISFFALALALALASTVHADGLTKLKRSTHTGAVAAAAAAPADASVSSKTGTGLSSVKTDVHSSPTSDKTDADSSAGGEDGKQWASTTVRYFNIPAGYKLACGSSNFTNDDFILEVSSDIFQNATNCHKHIKITAPNGKTAVGAIEDADGGPATSFNLSPAFFDAFYSLSTGVFNATWEFTNETVGIKEPCEGHSKNAPAGALAKVSVKADVSVEV